MRQDTQQPSSLIRMMEIKYGSNQKTTTGLHHRLAEPKKCLRGACFSKSEGGTEGGKNIPKGGIEGGTIDIFSVHYTWNSYLLKNGQ